jgi:hypothetical protein
LVGGINIEDAFGFESEPGHQAQSNRGSYHAGRPTAGLFTYVEDYGDDPAVNIIDSLRSGNSYSVQGQLISGKGFEFKACTSHHNCATMGETLKVKKGQRVTVNLVATDPKGANNSPYKFDNPSLLQVGIHEPVNEPSVRHIDFITGVVGEQFEPSDEEYFNSLAPETTVIAKNFTFDSDYHHDKLN